MGICLHHKGCITCNNLDKVRKHVVDSVEFEVVSDVEWLMF